MVLNYRFCDAERTFVLIKQKRAVLTERSGCMQEVNLKDLPALLNYEYMQIRHDSGLFDSVYLHVIKFVVNSVNVT